MKLFNRLKKPFAFVKYFSICCLIPLYFVLEANNQYWELIPLTSSIKISLITLFSVLATFLVLQLFVRKEAAIMAVCWLALHYLYFGVIRKSILSVHFLSFLVHYKFYLLLLFFLTLLYFFWILKVKDKNIMKLTSYITVLLLLFVSFEIYRAIKNANTTKTNVLAKGSLELKPNFLAQKPDVFLIVMDEYAGRKPLWEHYKYDNSDFSKNLESNGFFIAKNSTSNYNGTLFSTLSLLNMRYLDMASIGDVKSAKAYARIAKAIEQNLLFNFFRESKYKVINNSFLRIKHTSTKPFLILPVEDRLILDKTFGNILQSDLLLNLPSNKIQFLLRTFYAESDSYNQERIAEVKRAIADSSTPVFMYTHLMMPHSPYIRDENGKLRDIAEVHKELKAKQYGDSYIRYLKHCNKVVKEITDSILAVRKNPIIVLVSDHGNRFIGGARDLGNEFSNFVAVYSADKNYKGITDTVSLVNVFRLVLRNQFGQPLDILPNYQINVTKGGLN